MDSGSPVTRRAFVTHGVAAVAVGMAGVGPKASVPAPARHRSTPTPFTLGVASGDPSPDGMVLWTRLARRPLDSTGRGGMPPSNVDVDWQLARDPGFREVLRTGTATARPGLAHSVHVELAGLEPGTEYFYRFRSPAHLSPVGRTRTAPSPTSRVPLHAAVASCAHWEHGFFTAYRHLAESGPDVVLFLGDYIYGAPAGADGLGVPYRVHAGPRTTTLAAYRLRHTQYKTDPDLQAAHAAAPWVLAYDDHDVLDGWADETSALPRDRHAFPGIRAAAMQAYYENMPLRRASRPLAGHMQMYRRLTWGQVANLHVLDTRQYRDAQPCRPGYARQCAERFDPDRSMLGRRQEAWLAGGLRDSTAEWDVLAQEVFFCPNRLTRARHDRTPHRGTTGWNMDAWDGYTAARDRVLASAEQALVRNLVVLSGDVHASWANEILRDFDVAAAQPLGVELVVSSISSGGDGRARTGWGKRARATQPYLRFFDRRRGWLALRISPEAMRADFNVVPYVSRPGAPMSTAASFLVESGKPQLHRV